MYGIDINFVSTNCEKTFTKHLTAWIDLPVGMMYAGNSGDIVSYVVVVDSLASYEELGWAYDDAVANLMRIMDKLEFLH